MNRFQIATSATAALFLLSASPNARAMCNAFDPNQRVVGYTAGPMGMQIPICVPKERPAESSPAAPTVDPMQARANAAQAQASLMQDTLRRRIELEANPEYQRLKKGSWSYAQPGSDGGQSCRATFQSLGGMLGLIAPVQPGEQVMTMFSGPDIPKPRRPKRIELSVSLDGRASKIEAMHLPIGDVDFGTFGVGSPDLASVLANVRDSGSLTIDLNGKRVYEVAYQGGNEMKARMQACSTKYARR